MSIPKGRRRRRRRINLRKALFVLPNLFTLSSIFCGFFALITIFHDAPGAVYRAALAVFFAIFFDGTDGRIARLTHTQSGFGVQLDSLADVISFGVAPAIIVYRWALEPMGTLGIVMAFVFVACGALRLARFNVSAQEEDLDHVSTHFTGLPIPIAAGTLISAILCSESNLLTWHTHPTLVTIGLVLLGYLMVSTMPYRTYKNIRADKAGFSFFFAILAGFSALAILASPSLAMFAFLGTYVILGLTMGIVQKIKRLSQAPGTTPTQAP